MVPFLVKAAWAKRLIRELLLVFFLFSSLFFFSLLFCFFQEVKSAYVFHEYCVFQHAVAFPADVKKKKRSCISSFADNCNSNTNNKKRRKKNSTLSGGIANCSLFFFFGLLFLSTCASPLCICGGKRCRHTHTCACITKWLLRQTHTYTYIHVFSVSVIMSNTAIYVSSPKNFGYSPFPFPFSPSYCNMPLFFFVFRCISAVPKHAALSLLTH